MRAGSRRQLACVLGISLLVGLPAALTMASYQAATLDEAGDIFGDSEFVVLEPEKWVGKRFPLLKYIDIGDQLAEGKWIVVLYHYDCPNCEEVVARHEQLLAESSRIPEERDVALVEVPLFRSGQPPRMTDKGPLVCGRLDEAREWFVETPAEFLLEGGKVVKYCGATELISQDGREIARQELDRS